MISETKITARYAETDQMGIIHHSVYPIWYEVARTDFIKQLGMTYSGMEKTGIMLPLVELKCRYLIPSRYEDEITVKVHISLFTHVKIEFTYELFRNDGTCINIGSTLHAWTNLELHPISLKKKFPEIYRMVAGAAESESESPNGKKGIKL